MCLFLFFLTGCFETAQIYTAQHNYYQQRYDDAVQRLSQDQIPQRDALLALLEKGMALQAAGRYAESAEAWREAETLMEKQDIFHAGEQALSLLFDQNILAYQPAPYEKPFLHALLCLDYLFIRDFSAARVEAVKSLKNLEERESVVGPISFVRYVAALAFESTGDVNDAYIEYKKIHEAGVEGFLPTLIRLSATLGFEEEHNRYLAEVEDTGTAESSGGGEGEIPLILFLGKSPRKVASEVVLDADYKIVLPVFQTQSNILRGAQFISESASPRDGVALTSVETLASRFSGRLLASELLKEVLRQKAQKHLLKKVGDKVGTTTEKLLKTVFFFAREADLRSWSSLPAYVHLVMAPAAADSSVIQIRYTDQRRLPLDRDTASIELPPQNTVPFALLRAW